jgi:hypothetical protein
MVCLTLLKAGQGTFDIINSASAKMHASRVSDIKVVDVFNIIIHEG